MITGVLRIDYTEPNQTTYKGIRCKINKKVNFFNTGNITVDFIDYLKWLSEFDFDLITYSSSWDHFFMDGEGFELLYINHETDKNHVTSIDDYDGMEKSIGYPIPVGNKIKTFENIKDYYKYHKYILNFKNKK